MSGDINKIHYRGKMDQPDQSNAFAQYRQFLLQWCIYKRRHRKGQGWAGWETTVTVDEPMARAVAEMVVLDLGELAGKLIWAEFIAASRGSLTSEQKLKVSAWSVHYPMCILCHSKRFRHRKGGRCHGCCFARWLKVEGVKKLLDRTVNNERKKNEYPMQTDAQAWADYVDADNADDWAGDQPI